MTDMADFIQVITTTPTREDAHNIARVLVEGRLAACVQLLGPIQSTYWWHGAVETADEWLCLIKSEQSLLGALQAAIQAVHPYEVPEIVAVPIVAGAESYLSWMAQELGQGET